jgi:S1-C subfamily serine protease
MAQIWASAVDRPAPEGENALAMQRRLRGRLIAMEAAARKPARAWCSLHDSRPHLGQALSVTVRALVVACPAIMGMIAVRGPALAQLRAGDVAAVSIESPHPYPDGAAARPVVWSATVHRPGATFVKLHFSALAIAGTRAGGAPRGDYVSLQDAAGVERQVLTGLEPGDRWAPAIAGDTVVVALHADGHDAAFGVVIDRVGFGTIPLEDARPGLAEPAMRVDDHADDLSSQTDGARTTCGSDDKRPLCLALDPAHVRAADPVARLLIATDAGSLFFCTGFLFDPHGDLMTSAHCVPSACDARGAEVWWNYADETTSAGACGVAGRPNPDVYVGAELLAQNCRHDVAILRIADADKGNPAAIYGWLALAERAPVAGEDLWVAQHPLGGRKEIAAGGTVAADTQEGVSFCCEPPLGCVPGGTPTDELSDLGHTADTSAGSSGAPLVDAAGEVIGIHHAGGCGQTSGINAAVRADAVAPLVADIPALDVRRLVVRPGMPGTVRLEVSFAWPAISAADPAAAALRLVVSGDSTTYLDTSVPAGSLHPNARGTRWRYDPDGVDSSLRRLVLKSQDGRRFKLVLVARVPIPAGGEEPSTVVLDLGDAELIAPALGCDVHPGRTICSAP